MSRYWLGGYAACLVATAAAADDLDQAERRCAEPERTLTTAERTYCRGLAATGSEAYRLLLAAAEAGHVAAQYEVATRLWHGDDVAEDVVASRRWLLKAAEAGLSDAQNDYGFAFFYGMYGESKDRAKAIPWLQKAADQGNANSLTLLAEAHHTGDGLDRDPAKAVSLYRAAAAKRHLFATYMLGVLHRDGLGVERDSSVAASLLEAAARRGLPAAQYDLAYVTLDRSDTASAKIDALAWLLVAEAGGLPVEKSELDVGLKPDDVDQARRLAAVRRIYIADEKRLRRPRN